MFTSCLNYHSTSFSLEYTYCRSSLQFDLQLFTPHITTQSLPRTVVLLQKYQPSVLRTKCFNEENLPFQQEVKNTELGHLFEHIFLDQICACKLEQGWKSAKCRGETCWNWESDPVGMYHITVSTGRRTSNQLLEVALTRSAAVFCLILEEAQQTPSFSA